MNVNKFRGRVVEVDADKQVLAKNAKMSLSTYYRRLKDGGRDITLEEMESFVKDLNLTKEETAEIFLP